MTLFSVFIRLLALAPLAMLLSGCFPAADSPADEEKDPYYLTGRTRYSSMDYDGAIEAYESALASNPKSAAAHRELGFLYEEKKGDYGAAIYHFERHLKLCPKSNLADTIRQHISNCKVELAKGVSLALVSRQMQDEMRRLVIANTNLQGQVEQLQAQLKEQAQVFSNRLAALTAVSLPAPASIRMEPDRRPALVDKPSSQVAIHPQPRTSTNAPKIHVVRSGETMAAIAKKYNLKLSALQTANPNLDSKKLKAGQLVMLPAPKN